MIVGLSVGMSVVAEAAPWLLLPINLPWPPHMHLPPGSQ